MPPPTDPADSVSGPQLLMGELSVGGSSLLTQTSVRSCAEGQAFADYPFFFFFFNKKQTAFMTGTAQASFFQTLPQTAPLVFPWVEAL